MEYVLLILLYSGFDPVGQTAMDGFSSESKCRVAAEEIASAYESMSGMLSTEFRCVSVKK